MNNYNKVKRNGSFKQLSELANLCEPGLLQLALTKREQGTSSSEVHSFLDIVTSTPERHKNAVRCAHTLAVFWDSFKSIPSVHLKFEEDAIQRVLEAGYPSHPQSKP